MKTTLTQLMLISGFILICMGCRQQEPEAGFEKFVHNKSIEELSLEFSDDLMAEANADMAELERINRNGTYQGNLESIDLHPTPEWYRDAKLCIFYDWGPYSIAGYGEKGWSRARYPDWYLNHM